MTIEVKHATQATGTDAGNGEIAKMQWNESHAISMASGALLGRSTAGAGAAEEIAIGSGLSLSAGTLSASGGGGGASALTISNKTAAYTVVAGDLGTIINCTSGPFTVSLTAAATLGAGFNCWIWNTATNATHVITIDPNASEQVDGVLTLVLRQGEGTQIVCDGTNWMTGDKKTMRAYSDNIQPDQARPVASGVAAVAIGQGSTSSGTASYSFGHITTASSSAATAIGQNSAFGGSKAVTGAGAMALGGSYASGTDSFAAAVANNTSTYGATGANSVAIGYQATASAPKTTAIGGERPTASASNAVALGGEFAAASGALSVVLAGSVNTASGEASYAFGKRAQAIQVQKYAYGHQLGTSEACQGGYMVLAAVTTAETATQLRSNTNAASTANQVILPNNSAHAFTGTVVARQQAAGGTKSAAWKVEGLIQREGSAGTTTLVASTVTAISNVPGWTLALSADTTNGGLAVTATGAAATNIRWVATIQTSEVTYA